MYGPFGYMMPPPPEDEKLVIKPKPPLRCKGCGKYMGNDPGSYIVFGGYGASHMKSKCMEACITKIREQYPDWTWKSGTGMMLNKVDTDETR